jgi:xanthine dehydrogenase YagT iron-sulfur-binding subunit
MPNNKPQAPDPADTPVMQTAVSRRGFMQGLGVSAAAASFAGSAAALAKQAKGERTLDDGTTIIGPGPVELTLNINGEPQRLRVDASTTLLEALRMHAGLTGSKEICDRGSCGGCSVLLNGTLMVSCMMLAVDAVGAKITTVEGLARNGNLDPLQVMFIKHDALQCGYCTPGLVVASRWLLNNTPRPNLEQIKHALSGNICRCGTYTNIFNAVLETSGQSPVIDPA